MRIRKQVYELTPADLETHQIWEFALDEERLDGQDEATVRPWKGGPPLNPADGMFVVRASFELADGARLFGYLTPPVQGVSGIGTIQPVIVAKQGQVQFWFGIRTPNAEEISRAYATLGRTANAVFPCRYASEVPLIGGPIAGVLKGFMHYRSIRDRTVVVVIE